MITILFWSCTQEISTKAINQIPEINILNPLNNSTITEGETILMEGQITDSRSQPDEFFVRWFVEQEIICDWSNPDDYLTSYCDWQVPMLTSPDKQMEIRAVVRDARQAGGSDSFTVTVEASNAPEAEIIQPLPNSQFYMGESFVLEGIVSDIETETDALTVEWKSSIDGLLEENTSLNQEGATSLMVNLSEGEHILSLLVIDGDNKSHLEQIPVLIKPENQAPSCEIVYPTGESSSLLGVVTELEANVFDPDVSTTLLTVEWYSDRNGFLGESMPSVDGKVLFPTQDLSSGNHQISIVVTDEMGLSCEHQQNHFVGEPPNVNINYPSSGEQFQLGDTILFEGMVADTDQNSSELFLSWSSSIDGIFFEGYPNTVGQSIVDYSELSGGSHIITLSVTDQQMLTSSDSISVSINTPPETPVISITPVSPYTNDTLTVQVSPSIDIDGQIPTYEYAWLKNGQSTNLSGPTVSSIFTSAGEIWSVQVTPFDGFSYGEPAQTQTLIENSPPSISSISISPSVSIFNDMELFCESEGFDLDDNFGSEFEISYHWYNDTTGVLLGEGQHLLLNSQKGMPQDVINCETTITDVVGNQSYANTSISVANRSPNITSVVTTEIETTTQGFLGCSVQGEDVDGESIESDVLWYHYPQSDPSNRQIMSTSSSIQLDPSLVQPGDSISCMGRVTDNSQSQAQMESNWVSVVNTPPMITSMLVNPPTGVVNTGVLTCLIQTYDSDGTIMSLDYSWENITTGLVLGTTPSVTLNPNIASAGDIIACTATATDIDGAFVSQTQQVAVRNGSPLISDVEITEQNGALEIISESTLICSATASDPDGNILISEYQWFNSSTATDLGEGNVLMLTNETTSPDDIILCTATVQDDDGDADSASTAIVVGNRLPVIHDVDLIGYDVDGQMTTSYNTTTTFSVDVQSSDLDEDIVELRYSWAVDGYPVPGNTNRYEGALDKYQIIDVTVTPFDGKEEGLAVSSNYAIIQNTKPTVPEIEIIPTNPVEKEDDLVCTITQHAQDPDPSDTIVYDFTFVYVTMNNPNLQIYTGPQSTTYMSNDTVPANEISAWENWFCKVRALDDELLSQPSAATSVLSDTVEIAARCDPEDGPKLFEYGLDFTCILPDIFMMGSPATELGRSSGLDADEDLHGVALTQPFFVATTEVTQDMFEGLMYYNPSQYSNCGGGCPVEKVDWHEASAFSNLLTRYHNSFFTDSNEHLEECYVCDGLEHLSSIDPNWPNIAKSMTCEPAMNPYECDGYRLPTEAEWELSARAYSPNSFWTPNGGGDFEDITENLCTKSNPVPLDDGTDIKDYMWFCANQPYDASLGTLYYFPNVGTKLPNGFGMYDMHGNVAEWTHDTYVQHLGNDSVLDPLTTDDTPDAIVGDKVTRGGYALQNPVDMRCAHREKNSANYAGSTIGFRVARGFVE